MALPPPIQITDAARERIHMLVAQSDKPVAGLKISLKTKGCSGLAYDVDYIDAIAPGDEVIALPSTQGKEVAVAIDPKAILYLIGAEMDYVEEQWKSGFVFRNPNEKGRCGCGESFHV